MPQKRISNFQSTKNTKNDSNRGKYEDFTINEARDFNGPKTRSVTFQENDFSSNNTSMPELKIALARERSFVRTRSRTAKEQESPLSAYSHNENSNVEIQRQRSFVHPMQMQHQVREPHPHANRRRNSNMSTNPRGGGKPAMEIYRPPTLRGPCFYDPNEQMYYNGKYQENYNQNYAYHQNHNASNQKAHNHNTGKKTGLNIHAKEFVYGKSGNSGGNNQLHHSKSSTGLYQDDRVGRSIEHSKSGHNLRSINNHSGGNSNNFSISPPSPRVHFSDEKENHEQNHRPPNLSVPPVVGVKRSKSLGCGDFKEFLQGSNLVASQNDSQIPDVGPFSHDIKTTITKAFNEPSALSGRHLMDVSRHLMTRVLESSRYAEPMARLCIAIIVKEKDETFLESLLNTCQEHFQERDRLLRLSTTTSTVGYTPPHPKWIAYMSFLNEMYTQLKRRHVQLMTKRMRNSETAPGLLLLTLLAQCCSVCLKEPSVNSLQEMECLFFVLTAIGKDVETELPHMMCRVMASARDAFINTVKVAAVRKTLLQLIEMHAAGWNMPAPAVMYYYPGSGSK